MDFLKSLLIVTLLTIIPGQIIRIPQGSPLGAITLTDIAVASLVLAFLFYSTAVKKSLKFPNKIFFPFVLFAVWSTSTIIWALTAFTPHEVATASLFLARFVAYFFLSIVVFNLVDKSNIKSWVNLILLSGTLYILTGFVQFLAIPDLTFLTPFGWDPHQRRIVGTVIDPNFSGYIFVLIFSLASSYYLFEKKKDGFLIVALLSFIALILTFSRSSYLAFIAGAGTIGIIKSPKLLAGIFIVLILTFALIPQVRTRIIGALTLDETAQARIESWQNALVIIRDNSLFGVGFNTYRFAQEKYNFFSLDNPQGGHSGGGVDSSLLLVTATTGAVGISLFILLLGSIIKTIAKGASSNPLRLATLASLFALLVHSLFVNSLFFPQIMLLIFPLIGLASKDDTK